MSCGAEVIIGYYHNSSALSLPTIKSCRTIKNRQRKSPPSIFQLGAYGYRLEFIPYFKCDMDWSADLALDGLEPWFVPKVHDYERISRNGHGQERVGQNHFVV